MHVGNYLGLVHNSEKPLARAFKKVAAQHGKEPDILQTCTLLSSWSAQHVEVLKPIVKKYSKIKSNEPDRLRQTLFDEPRKGSLALLRDLHDLWLLANEVNLCWVVLLQAAKALRDEKFQSTCEALSIETDRQITWLLTRIKQAAPQSLVVAA